MALMRVIDVLGGAHDIEGEVGRSIMESLRKQSFGVTALCGGMCSCATCHVYVGSTWIHRLPPPVGNELFLLQELSGYRGDRSRLCCQVAFEEDLDGIELEVAPEE